MSPLRGRAMRRPPSPGWSEAEPSGVTHRAGGAASMAKRTKEFTVNGRLTEGSSQH